MKSRKAGKSTGFLRSFRRFVSEHSGELSLNYYNITEIAFIYAKAEYSYRIDRVEPIISDSPKIDLRSARHPLIDKKNVVPIDVSLGYDFDSLVITGPNTGGKTVTLKNSRSVRPYGAVRSSYTRKSSV